MIRRKSMIGSEEFRDRIVALCLKSGSRGVPRKARDRHIVLKSAAMRLDPHGTFTLDELDKAIERWIGVVAQRMEIDGVALRRALVYEGYLSRDPVGLFYVAEQSGPEELVFSKEVEELDPFDIALHGVCDIEQRRIDRFPSPDSPEGKKLIKARLVARQLLDGDVSVRAACLLLSDFFDGKCPFLCDLIYFECGFRVLVENEFLARLRAAEFLKKSDEWVHWLKV
jgi:hypothetical protein